MALIKGYVISYRQLPKLFNKIRDGQAPGKFSQQHLKDIGFPSSNLKSAIPLMKSLGFLTPDGSPTQRYHDYRDHSRSEEVMAEALREAYQEIFVIKEHPTKSDKAAIKGKFKSAFNVKDNVADLMTQTFLSLLELADLSKKSTPTKPKDVSEQKQFKPTGELTKLNSELQFSYNIQIHLPATKDVEVFNAIFKSLKDNLIG